MADPNNPGQFGNRSDTKAMASEGGSASSSQQDMSKLGKKVPQPNPAPIKPKVATTATKTDS